MAHWQTFNLIVKFAIHYKGSKDKHFHCFAVNLLGISRKIYVLGITYEPWFYSFLMLIDVDDEGYQNRLFCRRKVINRYTDRDIFILFNISCNLRIGSGDMKQNIFFLN